MRSRQTEAVAVKLLVLKDRRPGEYRKALGLAAIIGRTQRVGIETVDAAPRRFARDRLRRLVLARSGQEPGRALAFLYGIDPADIASPDIVIGAGRPTAAAGILLRRLTGAKFIYCGYLRDYDAAEIDLKLVGTPRLAGEPGCALAPIPTSIDPDILPRPRRLRSPQDLAGAAIGLFVGGPRSGYDFSKADWERLAELVVSTARLAGVRWSVASSRRTPEPACRAFDRLAAAGIIERYVDARAEGAGSADALFGADAIVVTEDSLSMIAEGLAALRPVIALRPPGGEKHGYAEELVTLACGGGLLIRPLASTSAESFVRALLSLEPPAADPRDAIEAAIAPVLRAAASLPRNTPVA